MVEATVARRLPVGAEAQADGGTHFRVWGPKHDRIAVVLESAAGKTVSEHPLAAESGGYFSGVGPAGPGMRYRFRLSPERTVPDPASRWQPDGPHGASAIVDPLRFAWTDAEWRGPADARHVIYELHIGTFTPEGTWQGAAEQLPHLARLGVTLIEIMPLADVPGRFNWGYDGVALFAPAHAYGTPDDMRTFVDRAHDLGLGVILDVVYNHLGPDGCYLRDFADDYFSAAHGTDWGDAINFDGNASAYVREFFLANAEYWIREFHLDGLRLDATQNIYDTSHPHILREIVEHVCATAGERRIWIFAENEAQETRLIRPTADDGFGIDAMWNDDFHHSAMVALTGRSEAYYTDYAGTPQELISCAKFGFLYQGQHYAWQRKRRGTPTRGVPGGAFINFLQNHDQIANSASGQRIHELTGAGELRALTALLLLMPGHAMLFQGQEFAASSPFLFFADHVPELSRKVHAGRKAFLMQFPSLALPSVQDAIDDPAAEETFQRCRLDHGERGANEHVWLLHHDLIHLSREDPVFAAQDASALHGAVLDEHVFVLRYFAGDDDDRLIIVNLGAELLLRIAPEPLLAPPRNTHWTVLFSTEDSRYGGTGGAEPEQLDGWHITARSTTVLRPDGITRS